jgi:hypothetical protein
MSKLYAMTQPHSPSQHVRIGDRERTETAERLSAHAAAGRLGVDELEQRLERANAAVFAADLQALEADLPGPARPDPRRAWRPPFVPGVLLAGLLAAVVASVAIGHPIVPVFLFAVLLWRWGAFPFRARWLR